MKIKTSKLIAVLCAMVMMILTIVPISTLTVAAAEESATLSFASKDQRTSFNTSEQVWEQNGIKLTNKKGSSTSNVADYANPARFYKNSSATIECSLGKITKIVFTCSGSSYAKAATVTNGSASTSGSTMTITMNEPSDTVSLVFSGSQIRANSMTVYYEASGTTEPDTPACEHTNKVAIGQSKDATCTEAGITAGEKCATCGETVTAQEEIPATGHKYADGVCSVCGEAKPAVSVPSDPIKYTFSNYTAGVQYAEETHTLDDHLEMYINASHLNGELRLYSSSTNNGIAVFKSADGHTITGFAFNAGYKVDTLNVYGSNDEGITWTLIEEVSITSTSYKDYTVGNSFNYAWIKLDVAGSNQIRLKSITVTFDAAGTVCNHPNTKVLEGYAATCTTDGLTDGLQCTDCDQIITVQATIPAGHEYVEGVCTVCGEKLPDYSGRYYIATIRSEGNYWYMSSNLGTAGTKRYQATDSGLTELPSEIVAPIDGHVFVLENNGDGTYYIYAEGVQGNNYIGWTSGSNSGTLVSKDKALRLKVDAVDGGLFNIHFTNNSEERYLSLNGTANNDYFAFYAGTQKHNLALVPFIPMGEISNVAVALGTDLSMLYNVTFAEGEDAADFRMVFTLNGKTVEASAKDGIYKLGGIAPHMMGDTVTATLYKGEVVVDVLEYSIKQYLEAVINGDYSAEAKQLATDLLVYGAAAQKNQDYNTENLVTNATPTVDEANKPDSNLDKEQVADKIEGVSFTSVGVNFSHVNKLYVAINNAAGENITVKVNGVANEIVDGFVYTTAIAPTSTSFDEVYTFELYVDGELYQTVTYSVNSYISAKWDAESGLAKALYNYAISFANYQ